MESKKDLGTLFKKHLKEAEAEPSAKLWETIESTLDAKKKRRGGFLFLWGGLTIVLIILSFSFVFFSDSINVKDIDIKEIPVSQINSPNQDIKNKVDTEATEVNYKINLNNSSFKDSTNMNEKSTTAISRSDINASTSVDRKHTYSNILHTSSNHKNNLKNQIISSNTNFTQDDKSVNQKDTKAYSLVTSKIQSSQNLKNTNKNKKIVLDENKEVLTKADSIQEPLDSKIKLTKKETIISNKKKKKKETTDDKWSISVQTGPNAFEYLVNSKPFNGSINDGELKSKGSYAIGALLNILLNDKFTFRLGYRYINYNFNIDEATAIVKENGTLSILTDSALERNGSVVTSDFQNSLSPPNALRISQEINYQEIPFQLLYKIRNKRIQIDAIIGASAMLLTKNNILLSNYTSNQEIGSAAYLKKTSWSSSLGLGFRYKLTDRLTLDLEPSFQFQHGTFEKGFKKLRPAILNLNAGATIKL